MMPRLWVRGLWVQAIGSASLLVALSGCAAETAMEGAERDRLNASMIELSDEVRQLRATVDALRQQQTMAAEQAAAMSRATQMAIAPSPSAPRAAPAAPRVGMVITPNRPSGSTGSAPASSPPRSILPSAPPPVSPAPPPLPAPASTNSGGSQYGDLPDSLPPAATLEEAVAMLAPLTGGTPPATTPPPAAAAPVPAPSAAAPIMPDPAAMMEPPPTGNMPTTSADALLGETAGQVGIHLVSMRQPDAAQQAWAQLVGRYADVLGPLQHRVSAIDFGDGRGTFYRLKAGPFDSQATAEQVCAALRSRGAYCALSDFLGS